MAWNTKHHHAAAIVAFLAFLAPTACHGGLLSFPILCSGGWVRPIPIIGWFVCPDGSSGTPMPPPTHYGPVVPPTGEGLYDNYYSSSCPNAEAVVRRVVEEAISSSYKDPGSNIGAGLIRLHFHDCFVVGCDASVLLTTTKTGNTDTELEGAPNKDSLRGFEVINKIKDELDKEKENCREIVSCADILAYAARDAARKLSGGRIEYTVPGGRWDGLKSFAANTSALPAPFFDLATLKSMFAAVGLDEYDLVALSGAHSIGRGRCRFRSQSPPMDAAFAAGLSSGPCLNNAENKLPLDYKTADNLDSQYYHNIVDKKVLFDTDAALSSTETIAQVDAYRVNLDYQWEKDFWVSMVKMGKIGTRTKADKDKGAEVEIRKQCWTVNNPPSSY